MPQPLQHSLHVPGNREQLAKQDFVSGLRAFVLNDVANDMKTRYEQELVPSMKARKKAEPQSGPEVHRAIKDQTLFRFYSSMRYNAQEMVWHNVIKPLRESEQDVNAKVGAAKEKRAEVGGSLELNESLPLPKNVSELDVHLAPGSYHRADEGRDWMAGAIYDHGLNIFSFGMMGANLDDIGQSMAQYIRHKFSDFKPTSILDVGCTIGHNTCAWKETYPEAQVTGIDVAAPCLEYGHARAVMQGNAVDFKQMNATSLTFEDDSMDVVFSSMFLHELSVKDIKKVMSEAYRVLKPGGLMLHMELPPNDSLTPYDAFYLDWDAYYNNEPFYKTFRDQNFEELRVEAGFEKDKLFHLITPQYTYQSSEQYAEAIKTDAEFGENTGRLAEGIEWYGFGAWK